MSSGWRGGGVVTQRSAKPCTRVRIPSVPPDYARMVELVDTRDLKSLGHNGRAGSSPALRTKVYYMTATYDDFQKLDIRVGRIVEVQEFPGAHKPSYKLSIDFGGGIGVKKSCAQLPQNYTPEQLQDKQVLAVVNFPPRQIGPAVSEVLTLGVPDEHGSCILVTPDGDAPIGSKLY